MTIIQVCLHRPWPLDFHRKSFQNCLPCCISEYFWESSFVQAQDDSKPWKRSTWPSYELLFWHLDKMLGAASGKWQHNFEKAEQRCVSCLGSLIRTCWYNPKHNRFNTISLQAKNIVWILRSEKAAGADFKKSHDGLYGLNFDLQA